MKFKVGDVLVWVNYGKAEDFNLMGQEEVRVTSANPRVYEYVNTYTKKSSGNSSWLVDAHCEHTTVFNSPLYKALS